MGINWKKGNNKKISKFDNLSMSIFYKNDSSTVLSRGLFDIPSLYPTVFLTNDYSITELNSTSPSTSELGDLVDEAESDEANADNADDEDAVEDILYMRGATFTIHLDTPAENSTVNATKINEANGADRIELRATSQVTLFAIFLGLACRIAP